MVITLLPIAIKKKCIQKHNKIYQFFFGIVMFYHRRKLRSALENTFDRAQRNIISNKIPVTPLDVCWLF